MTTFFRPETMRTILFALFAAVSLILAPGAEGSDGAERYTVQVASYKDMDAAVTLSTLLKGKGYDPVTRTVEIPGKGEWKRVCLGDYASRDEALKAAETMREKGAIKHFLIVKIDPVPSLPAKSAPAKTSSAKPAPVTSDSVKPDPPKAVSAPQPRNEEPAAQKVAGAKEPPPPSLVLLRKQIPPSSAAVEENRGAQPPGDAAPPPEKEGAADTAAEGSGPVRGTLDDFTSGNYESALSKFEKILTVKRDETALRRAADCHYFLGEKGDKKHLSEAIDRYREVIRNYPGLNEENAQATYRLGDTYRRLGLNYEASVEFKNVYANYPRSDYAPESIYMNAVLLYETRRFDESIRMYKEYIARFPEGPRAREAYFGVGDCYSQLRQFNDANAWYDNALKKWPDLEDIPGAGLLRMGTHYLQAGKYDEARDVLFVYLNLYPDGSHARDALYEVARSFVKTEQTRPALKMFSLLIDRYPGTREAVESALMMANLGVDTPGIAVPGDILPGMNCYRNPVEAYRAMEGTLSDPAMAEEVAFRKTSALIKTKRYREAFDEGRALLANFPRGKHRDTAEKNLVTAARHLIDGYHKENDHVSVVDLYYGLDRAVLFGNGDYDMLSRIGRSLVEMNLLDDADGFFGQMAHAFEDGMKRRGISLEMAKIDYRRGRLGDAKKKLEALTGEQSGVDAKTAAAARTLMGDIAWQEGRFREAAGFYSAALDSGTDPEEGIAVRKRYADALREMGMYSSALVNYRRILDGCEGAATSCSVPVVARSYEGVGDCLYRKGEYRQALSMYEQSIKDVPEGKRDMWTLLNMERGYAKLGTKPAEGASTAPALQGEGDEFWSRVRDYYRTDRYWTDRYGSYIRDS